MTIMQSYHQLQIQDPNNLSHWFISYYYSNYSRYLDFLRPLMGASLSVYHYQVLQITWVTQAYTFSNHNSINSKKQLYIQLQLLYCFVLWKPHLIKHIQQFEQVQRCATKYVLNDFTSDYKSCLIKLQLLPLMYIFDLSDIMFFIKVTKHLMQPLTSPTMYWTYLTIYSPQAEPSQIFRQYHQKLLFPNLRLWNYLPVINTELSLSAIKYKLRNYLWSHFITNFNPDNKSV